MSEEEYAKLHAAIETLVFLTAELEKKHVSIQRLKQLLFGATTETTRKVIEKTPGRGRQGKHLPAAMRPRARHQSPRRRPKGMVATGPKPTSGPRRSAYRTSRSSPGDPCPKCKKGTVYESVEPGRLVRIRGQAPLGATVYELQKLRCNLCGEIFTAQTPPGVGPEKYDAESASMIALLKYGSGLPFNRLERLEGSLGIPLAGRDAMGDRRGQCRRDRAGPRRDDPPGGPGPGPPQ